MHRKAHNDMLYISPCTAVTPCCIASAMCHHNATQCSAPQCIITMQRNGM